MYLELFPGCLNKVFIACFPGVLEAGFSSCLGLPETVHVRVGLRLDGSGLGRLLGLKGVDGVVEFGWGSAHTRRVGGGGVSALTCGVVGLVLS